VGIIAWLVIGIVAGFLARLMVPGRDPMGIGGTLVLGLIGSLLGGLVGNLIAGRGMDFTPAGLIGSILGAAAVLLLTRLVRRGGVPSK
jgi:uncharacterized membrane protein YeaQ/YmgE (transglycosylase-associated protein family)